MSFEFKSLLKDKNVLYVTLFIAISNMFAYLMFRQFDAIIFFAIVGIITSHFSKNMIIIMLAAILSTNLALSIKVIGKVKEGYDNMKKDSKKKDGMKKDDNSKPKKKEGMKDKKDKKDMKDNKDMKDKIKCVGDSCLKGTGSSKEKFTQQLNPARVNAKYDDESDDEDYESQPTVNYASTLESAYDNLDKLLSSDAINNMTEDTHRLAEKQQMLMGNINKLQPMMEKAGSLLEGLDMGKMTSVFDGLTDKLGKMKGEVGK